MSRLLISASLSLAAFFIWSLSRFIPGKQTASSELAIRLTQSSPMTPAGVKRDSPQDLHLSESVDISTENWRKRAEAMLRERQEDSKDQQFAAEDWRVSHIHTGPMSTQVTFLLFYEDLPVFPNHFIRVDMKSTGELNEMSIRRPDWIKPSDDFHVQKTEAQQMAAKLLKRPVRLAQVADVCEAILWVSTTGQAMRAYRVIYDGEEVVISGSSGEPIHYRSHRKH